MGAVERGPGHRPQAPHRPGTASEPLLAPAAFLHGAGTAAQGGQPHGSAMARGTQGTSTRLGHGWMHRLAEISSSKTKMDPCLDSKCLLLPRRRQENCQALRGKPEKPRDFCRPGYSIAGSFNSSNSSRLTVCHYNR